MESETFTASTEAGAEAAAARWLKANPSVTVVNKKWEAAIGTRVPRHMSKTAAGVASVNLTIEYTENQTTP
jgi:hypothetical protein